MFNLKNYNAVYYPAKSNEPLNILIDYDLDYEDGYPVRVTGQSDNFSLDGKYIDTDVNPRIFPYSSEWYNKLKAVYPDLQPYVPDYRGIIKSILANTKTVVCKKSPISHKDATTNKKLVFVDADTKLFEDVYYVAVNPFTLEVCDSDMDYYAVPNLNSPF